MEIQLTDTEFVIIM